ncbi:MAG: hypothetical protein ACQETL_03995 [Bacteroidota bacterium]
MKLKLLIVFLFLSFVSCKEEDMESDVETEVIKVTLEGTELYEYSFGSTFPAEGGRSIRKQAKKYQISEIKLIEKELLFRFRAKEGFKGSQTVEIIERGSIGDNNYKDYYRWVFKFEIE